MKTSTILLLAFAWLVKLTQVHAQADSYPLFVVNYKEVGFVHQEIDALRKDRMGGYTSSKQAQKILGRMLSVCPSDTYLIIDQPGIEVGDFQQLMTANGLPMWTELRKFTDRSATLMSLPRLDAPVDLDRLVEGLSKKCEAKTILVDDPKQDPLFEKYEDTQPRVIRMQFDPLPTEDELEREIVLKRNDELLHEALKLTPSPFFTIIYTSSTGEEFDPEDPEFKQEKHWDIFADKVRAKRDPRNRHDWKKHQPRQPKGPSTDPITAVPPLAEKNRLDAKRKLKKDVEPEQYLSKKTVAAIMVTSVGAGVVYMALQMLKGIQSYYTKNNVDIGSDSDSRKNK